MPRQDFPISTVFLPPKQFSPIRLNHSCRSHFALGTAPLVVWLRPVPTLLWVSLHMIRISEFRGTGSIRPNRRPPTVNQPRSASRIDSVHPQSRHILLSTPRTIAVASQQASHHRGGRATIGHHRTTASARG